MKKSLILMNQRIFIIGLTIVLSFIACYADSGYSNPVMPISAPDPTVIQGDDGFFYVYPTCNKMRLPIYRSKDLINWNRIGYAFPDNTNQNSLTDGNIWAPDIIKYKGSYLMAYSLSKNGEYHDNGIGLAISKTPTGPFKDLGLLFTSDSIGVRNSIDPSLIEENGKLFLLWGSFNGLYIIELSPSKDSFYIKGPSNKIKLAGNAFEGAHIFKKFGYYYLFASSGSCCKGAKSTYHVVVGRSKNLLGPYVNKQGIPMIENGSTLVVKGNNEFAGPGHGSQIITDDKGKTWYLYHSFQKSQIKKARQLMLDEIKWTKDHWPYIKNNVPTLKSKTRPYFINR